MKKKNTAKKALLPALLAVLCSTAALTSVSYAWFTMGKEASVNQIDVNVKSADGMEISTDALTWKSQLLTTDLGGNVQGFTQLVPVSTVGTVTDGVEQMFVGTVEDNGTTITAKKAENNEYMYFDLYFRVTKAHELHLNVGSFVKGVGSDAHLYSRVSFADLGSTEGEPQAAKDLAGSTTSAIWEPNAKIHTERAVLDGKATQGEVDSDFVGVKSEITTGLESSAYEACFGSVTTLQPAQKADLTTEATIKIADLEKGINKIRVCIWAEGQDDDCLNAASGGQIQVGLNFVGVEA